jgi:hypothetical protein
VREARGRRYW